jgi:hypothetical protein
MSNDSDLVTRISRIEASLRLWRLAALGSVVVAVVAMAWQRTAAAAPEGEAGAAAVTEVVRARSFVLVDSHGRERVTLRCEVRSGAGSANESEYPAISLLDGGGKLAMFITDGALVVGESRGDHVTVTGTSLSLSNGGKGLDEQSTVVWPSGISVTGKGTERPSFSCGITKAGGVRLDLETHEGDVRHYTTLGVQGSAEENPLPPGAERALTPEQRAGLVAGSAERRFSGRLSIGAAGVRDSNLVLEGIDLGHSGVLGQTLTMKTAAGSISLNQPRDTAPSLSLGDAEVGTRLQVGAVKLQSAKTGAATRYPAAIVIYKPDGRVLWMTPND